MRKSQQNNFISYPKPQYIKDNWVNYQTWKMISHLTFMGYFLAGNSVANLIQQIPLQGDLDFWVEKQSDFLHAFDQLSSYYEYFSLYPSMIEMYNQEGNPLPRINLIFTKLSPLQCVNRFDLDYCRCMWNPRFNRLYHAIGCKKSIEQKVIRLPKPKNPQRIIKKRILKAINYGYSFQKRFWKQLPYLLKKQKILPQKLKISELDEPYKILIEDLLIEKFQMKQPKLKITQNSNVMQTLDEIQSQYTALLRSNQMYKLPALLKFKFKDIKLLKEYIKRIILQNPLSDTQYYKFTLGNHYLNSQQFDEDYRQTYRLRINTDKQFKNIYVQEYEKQKYQKPRFQPKVNIQKLSSLRAKQEQKLKNTIFPNYNKTQQIIKLNTSGTAFIKISFLPKFTADTARKQFQKMWKLHPKQKSFYTGFPSQQYKVHRYTKQYIIDTFQSSGNHYYGAASFYYKFFPAQFRPYFDHMFKIDPCYNQFIVNWYQDKNDFIRKKSYSNFGMISGAQMSIVSLYPTQDKNLFRYLDFYPSKPQVHAIRNKLSIRLDHGTVITMNRQTQRQFLHGIDKADNNVAKYISILFRQAEQYF